MMEPMNPVAWRCVQDGSIHRHGIYHEGDEPLLAFAPGEQTRIFVGEFPDGPRVVVNVFYENGHIVGMEAALRDQWASRWGAPARMEEET